MYITNHMVHDREEMVAIHARLSGNEGAFSTDERHLYFCSLDEGSLAAYAVVDRPAPGRAVLEELVLAPQYAGQNVERGLIAYIMFELGGLGLARLELAGGRLAESFRPDWIGELDLFNEDGVAMLAPSRLVEGRRRT